MVQLNQILWKILYSLGNLQLAIVLLLVIAGVSSLGTIIEQDKALSFYEINYPTSNPIGGFIDSNLIFLLGLNHVYTMYWFFLLILLFASSLISCTFSRQIPSLKLARIWKFFKTKNRLTKSGISFSINDVSLNQVAYTLREKNYNVLQQGASIYAYKGLIGKVGPILVHASLILILMGSILGTVLGFMAQELIQKGDIFHLQNIIRSGPLSYIRQDFEGYIRDFSISYNDQGLVDQFYSDISILDNNLITKSQKTIFVNEPLRDEGMSFYQTDWSIVKLKFKLNDRPEKEILLKEIKSDNNSRFWIGSLSPETGSEKLFLILQDLTGRYSVYSSQKELLGESEVGHKIHLNGSNFRISSIIPSTGIQIKSDPGISIVYLGFLFLIFSITFSYKSYFQIWVIRKDNKLCVYGDTNRAVYFFEKNILEIVDSLQNEIIELKRNFSNVN